MKVIVMQKRKYRRLNLDWSNPQTKIDYMRDYKKPNYATYQHYQHIYYVTVTKPKRKLARESTYAKE